MKAKYNILFVTSFFILLLNSCIPYNCYLFKYINSSDHTISLIRYRENRIVSERSFFSLPPGDSHGPLPLICGHEFPGPPPYIDINTTIGDSIVVVFNDTLKVSIILGSYGFDSTFPVFGPKGPVKLSSWTLVNTRGNILYYEYEFTNWHFEWAVENARR